MRQTAVRPVPMSIAIAYAIHGAIGSLYQARSMAGAMVAHISHIHFSVIFKLKDTGLGHIVGCKEGLSFCIYTRGVGFKSRTISSASPLFLDSVLLLAACNEIAITSPIDVR